MQIKKWLLAVTFLLPASHAFASGFGLREFSAESMGVAYAGAAASDSNASFLPYNPASLGGTVNWDVSATGTGYVLNSSGQLNGATAAGTPAGGISNPSGFINEQFAPAFEGRLRLSPNLVAGISFTVPFGEATKFPAAWQGRYFAETSRILAYDIDPAIAYQLTPTLTIGAAAQIQHVNSELRQAIDFGTIGYGFGIPGSIPGMMDGDAVVHGSSWSAGWSLGALWKPMPSLALGVGYRSKIDQTLSGNEHYAYDTAGIGSTLKLLSGAFTDSSAKAKLPTPAILTTSARWDLGSGITALGTVEYTWWSAIRNLDIVAANALDPASLTVLNWKDSWFGSLGLEYAANQHWTWRAGAAFDQACSPAATLTPAIPDADRTWISAGATYHMAPQTEMTLAVSHLFSPQRTIAQSVTMSGNSFRGSLNGTTNADATLISFQVTYKGL